MREGTVRLGETPPYAAKRDAIHVALAPVVAAAELHPGQHVGLDGNGKASPDVKPIGIVDPFWSRPIGAGQSFWLLLYQDTVNGMRHHWRHPSFAEPQDGPKAESEAWLRGFAKVAKLDYDVMLDIIRDYIERDEVWIEHGSEYARDAYYAVDQSEFWVHVHRATGMTQPENPSWGAPFSCSC